MSKVLRKERREMWKLTKKFYVNKEAWRGSWAERFIITKFDDEMLKLFENMSK